MKPGETENTFLQRHTCPQAASSPPGSWVFAPIPLCPKGRTGLISLRMTKPIKSPKRTKGPSWPGNRHRRRGRKGWHPALEGGKGESGGWSQRPGGVVSSQRHKPEAVKGRPQDSPGIQPSQPHHQGPAGRRQCRKREASAGRGKRDPLLSPGAGFLSAGEVSNVRSPPPRIPSGGQASHFPFRKGQNKRPVEHIKGKSRSGPSAGSASSSPRAGPSPAGKVQDTCWLTAQALFYSLIHSTDTSPHLLCARLCAGRWGPSFQGAVLSWRGGHHTDNPKDRV